MSAIRLAKGPAAFTICSASNGKWVKLGWAYNEQSSEPQEDLANERAADPQFPEIVVRGAAAFIPALKPYIDEPPTRYSHYGGYYTMTEENWPLIGPMEADGAYMVAALSGFRFWQYVGECRRAPLRSLDEQWRPAGLRVGIEHVALQR